MSEFEKMRTAAVVLAGQLAELRQEYADINHDDPDYEFWAYVSAAIFGDPERYSDLGDMIVAAGVDCVEHGLIRRWLGRA